MEGGGGTDPGGSFKGTLNNQFLNGTSGDFETVPGRTLWSNLVSEPASKNPFQNIQLP